METTKHEDAVRELAHKISIDARFYNCAPFRGVSVKPELYYNNAGDPGCLLVASSMLTAYVEYDIKRCVFDVCVKRRISNCLSTSLDETGKRFVSFAEAAEWCVTELLYYGARAAK